MKENDDVNNREDELEEAKAEEIQEIPEGEIARLKSELEARGMEAQANYDRFLRAAADLENYKKRVEKEKADIVSFANESLIEDVLPAIDNFERALSHANGEENLESLKKGVKLTIDQLYGVLKKFGLDEIRSVGEKFDPSIHHAISEEDSEAEPGTVVKEFQKGYFLKGRLLRPSMVAVAKRPGPSQIH